MQQWEYRHIYVNGIKWTDGEQREGDEHAVTFLGREWFTKAGLLASLGKDGWEVAGIIPDAVAGAQYVMVVKRPAQ